MHREAADTSERDALIAADAAAAEARRSADVARQASARAALQAQATAGQLDQMANRTLRRCVPVTEVRGSGVCVDAHWDELYRRCTLLLQMGPGVENRQW